MTGDFDSGAVACSDTTNWVLIYTLAADGKLASVEVDVGAGGAIAHFKVSQAAVRGGTHRDLAVDSDFAAATDAIPLIIPPDSATPVYQAQASANFQLELASGAQEYGLWAKAASTATTVRARGRVGSRDT